MIVNLRRQKCFYYVEPVHRYSSEVPHHMALLNCQDEAFAGYCISVSLPLSLCAATTHTYLAAASHKTQCGERKRMEMTQSMLQAGKNLKSTQGETTDRQSTVIGGNEHHCHIKEKKIYIVLLDSQEDRRNFSSQSSGEGRFLHHPEKQEEPEIF